VRDGALVPVHPADHVRAGLGDVPESERPLELTVWGDGAWEGAGLTLADGTRVRRRRGQVVSDPPRDVAVRVVEGGWPTL
jgi:hypothetical protein